MMRVEKGYQKGKFLLVCIVIHPPSRTKQSACLSCCSVYKQCFYTNRRHQFLAFRIALTEKKSTNKNFQMTSE